MILVKKGSIAFVVLLIASAALLGVFMGNKEDVDSIEKQWWQST